MKKIIMLAVLLVSTIVLSGCSLTKNDFENTENSKIKVAASIFPIYSIVSEIAGDRADVNLILSAGASPHTFEMTTSQIKNLQGTKKIFVNGQNLDSWVNNVSSVIVESEIVDLSEVVDLKRYEENVLNDIHDEYDEHDEYPNSYDPHYWLSPANIYTVAEEILNQLCELSPQDQDYFSGNYNSFVNRLQSKDVEWQEKINSLSDKNIFVFHDAWGYFADHFGLNIVGTFEPFPGQEPSAQYITELQDKVKENNIKTLFVEPQLSQNSIQTLAKDLGVSIEIIDPLGGVEGRASYIEMMDYNVENIYNLQQK